MKIIIAKIRNGLESFDEFIGRTGKQTQFNFALKKSEKLR